MAEGLPPLIRATLLRAETGDVDSPIRRQLAQSQSEN
jgi:hypothetical protein